MKENNILKVENMKIINLGLIGFYDAIKRQDVPCIHIDWKPPAGGKPRLMQILDKLNELG